MIVERAYARGGPCGAGERPWPLPRVCELLRDGLRFTAPVTFVVGENGSGRPTLVEAPAEGFGPDPWGGSHEWRYASHQVESPLGGRVRSDAAARGRRMPGSRSARQGFFLRAGTARDVLDREGLAPDARSHGEGFLAAFRDEFRRPGLYVLDEPEAAPSFSSCPEPIGRIDRSTREGAQVVCATHSPPPTALPGTDIVEAGDHGMRRTTRQDLALVDHWRRHLADPRAYPRHVRE